MLSRRDLLVHAGSVAAALLASGAASAQSTKTRLILLGTIDAAKAHFHGTIVVGKDLMEL